MHAIGAAFNAVLYQPIFNLLIGIYDILPYRDIGIAIILLTIIVRVVLYPFSLKALSSQRNLQQLQPKIKKIQESHKENKEEQAKKLMELYREHGVSPFSGCLPLLIQFPVLIALYQSFLNGLKPGGITGLYPFVPNPGTIQPLFLSLLDLTKNHNAYLAILAGAAQFWQSKQSLPKRPEGAANDAAYAMNRNMLYMMPAMTVILGYTFPAGLAIYWIVYTLFTVFQQWHMQRFTNPAGSEVAATP